MSSKIQRAKPEKGMLPHLPDETMNLGRMKIRTSGKEEAGKYFWERNGSDYDPKKALPIGGGDIGAAVHGYPDNYTLNIAKNDLWWNDFDNPVPCYYKGGIKELRERILSGDPELKLDLYDSFSPRTSRPNQTSAARLTFHFCSGAVFAHVKEHLDLAHGIVTTTFNCQLGAVSGNDFKLSSSVGHFDDIITVRADASPNAEHFGKISFELTKDPMEVDDNLIDVETPPEVISRMEAEIEEHFTARPFIDGDFYGFDMNLRSGDDFKTAPDNHYTVMMCSSDRHLTPYIAGSKLYCEGRPKGQTIFFLLTVVSTLDAADTRAEAKRRLERSVRSKMTTSFGAGWEFFDHAWNRSWVRLPENKITYPWYWGIYQALSARKPGKTAPGYLAPWYASTYASWGFHILTYEQAKSNLGLLTSNHSELLEPWFRLLKDSKEKLQKFTRDYYGMEGTAYPHSISGTGTIVWSCVQLNGNNMNIQTTGESVKYCWDYYEFTQDKDFLKEVGYPFLKEAAIFYDNFLLTADDGEKYLFPSRSQEFVNTVGLSNEFMTNSIIDLCLARNTLDKAAKAADILGIDPELSGKWKEDLAHLRPDYATWPDGTWKVSEDADDRTLNYGCPAVSDIAPITYTGEVDKWHGTPEMQEAAYKTVKALVPEDEIPWDRSFALIARCRLGDKDFMRKMLYMIPEQYETGGNLNDPFADQMGYTVNKGCANISAVINEMLLQSQGGVIRVFPAYPEDLGDTAFWSLRARGAFLVASEMRKTKVPYVILRSLAGCDCTFANLYGKNLRITDFETGEEIAFSSNGENITFQTQPAHEYLLEDKTLPYADWPVID